MPKYSSIQVCVLNNSFVGTVTKWVDCAFIKPMFETVIRGQDKSGCWIAKRVFLFSYLGDVFGTTQFKNLPDYNQWYQSNCTTNCIKYIMYNGCYLKVNNCNLKHN